MTALLKDYTTMEEHYDVQPGKQEIILMLLNGVSQKIDDAKDAQTRGELVEKGFYLGRATAIVDGLRNMLSLNNGDPLSEDLNVVYNHVDLCLQAATGNDSDHYLDEAAEIIDNIAIGCGQIPPEIQVASVNVMQA